MKHLKECKSTLYILYLYGLHAGPWEGVTGFQMSYVERGRGRVRTLIAITLRDW